MKPTDLPDWLQQTGLEAFAILLLDVAEPLAPFGAQLLWIMQPFMGRQRAADWANWLEDPHHLAQLRKDLSGEESDS